MIPVGLLGGKGMVGYWTRDGHFQGVLHQNRSYPLELGAYLWALLQGRYKDAPKKMIRDVVKAHPAGWVSLVPGPAMVEVGKGLWEFRAWAEQSECYCHGYFAKCLKSLPAQWTVPFTDQNIDWFDIHWAYLLDPREGTLSVLVGQIEIPTVSHARGQSSSDINFSYKILGTFHPWEEEPDWKLLQAEGYAARNIREQEVRKAVA